jgi:hypothetical protein
MTAIEWLALALFLAGMVAFFVWVAVLSLRRS